MATEYSENGALGTNAGITQTAAQLDGQYFAVGGVTVSGAAVVSVVFDDGVHSGDTMTITPLENAAGTQIRGWQCAGLDVKYLPTACR
ncbi:MAG: pilin [Pseudomonadales bacterium]|nr:pilin [Pseudomonadales bacterium]